MPFLDGEKLFMFIHSPSVMVSVISLHPPGVFNSQQDAVQGKSKFDMKSKTFVLQTFSSDGSNTVTKTFYP